MIIDSHCHLDYPPLNADLDKVLARAGGDTHVTKEGKTARKGLWYNIHQKRKRGEKMRKKGAKGAPTAKAIKASQA